MTKTLNKDEWRSTAHNVIADVAINNQYISSDIVIAALEQAGLGLTNYSALGGVFTRAAKANLIEKMPTTNTSKSHSVKTVWRSLTHQPVRAFVPMNRKQGGKTQETAVLELIQRPSGATNWELSRVALKYTSVISELRADGYNIHAQRQRLKNGRASNTWLYTLIEGNE